MKKLIFTLALLVSIFTACDSNQTEIISETNSEVIDNSTLKQTTYIFKEKEYKITVDYSNKEKPIILDGKDNEFLSKILQFPELVIVQNMNDPKIYLFTNNDDYKNSSLLKIMVSNAKKVTSKSSQTGIAYFYKRGGFRYSGGGFFRTIGINNDFFEPNFHSISNSFLGNLFPSSWYNSGTIDINDDVSSLSVTNMYLVVYEHANYGGQKRVFNALGGTISISDLNRITYSCGFLCTRDWNDKISSSIGAKNILY